MQMEVTRRWFWDGNSTEMFQRNHYIFCFVSFVLLNISRCRGKVTMLYDNYDTGVPLIHLEFRGHPSSNSFLDSLYFFSGHFPNLVLTSNICKILSTDYILVKHADITAARCGWPLMNGRLSGWAWHDGQQLKINRLHCLFGVSGGEVAYLDGEEGRKRTHFILARLSSYRVTKYPRNCKQLT